MTSDNCYLWKIVCFVPFDIDGTEDRFFGFSEFLTAFALMLIVLTVADFRYRFRLGIASFLTNAFAFWILAFIGAATLFTDAWRANRWLVPDIQHLTYPNWQLLLGIMLLLTLFRLIYVALIKPPIYSKHNAKYFWRAFYHHIVQGSPSHMATIATELIRSAKSIIQHAPERIDRLMPANAIPQRKFTEVEKIANNILLLIADKKFCRVIVQSSITTAFAFFKEIRQSEKYNVSIDIFARNIISEALVNKDSFLYQETEGHETGVVGYNKPLSSVMFSDYNMIETNKYLGLGLDTEILYELDAIQWDAYCRIVKTVLQNYVKHSIMRTQELKHALDNIQIAVRGISKFNGVENIDYHCDELKRLKVVLSFIQDSIEILEKIDKPDLKGVSVKKIRYDDTIYDYFANLIYEIIHCAAYVKSPENTRRWIHISKVYSAICRIRCEKNTAGYFIMLRVRRLLYDKIERMNQNPNYQGARLLSYFLSITGLHLSKEYNRQFYALEKFIFRWLKKNYAWLHIHHQSVAESCLVDGITFDPENSLLKNRFFYGLMKQPEYNIFQVESYKDSDNRPK